MGAAEPAAPGGAEVPWQIRIFRKSLKKKLKWGILERILPDPVPAGWRCLDLGCAKGTFSWLLRARGGRWVSADLDRENLVATRDLAGPTVCRVDYRRLPFADGAFDLVSVLDFLEHVEEDDRCLEELRRTLRPGGTFLFSAPATGRLFLANRLRRAAGLTMEDFGHVREGYALGEMAARLEGMGFRVTRRLCYSRFFTESLELLLNLYYVRKKRGGRGTGARDGAITPGSAEEVRGLEKTLRLYSLVYPLFWLVSQLDRLLFFTQGYVILILAEKPPDTSFGGV
jgi:SAM-dependent methyltransferase